MSEKQDRLNQLTNEVKDFHPLLELLLPKLDNVNQVEYAHGREEKGADFLLSKSDTTLGGIEYVGVIAKVDKITSDISKIEQQIKECGMPRQFEAGKKTIR